MKIQSFNCDSPLVDDFTEFSRTHYNGDPYFSGSDQLPGEQQVKLFIAYENQTIVGRAAALINTSIHYNGTRTGLIGWYECMDNDLAAKSIISAVGEFLQNQRCDWVIGPLNGTTWNRYRLTVPSENRPFFLENYHKEWYMRQFQNNNFSTIASYYSTQIILSETIDERISRFQKSLKERGITVRNLKIEQYEDEIMKIYQVCVKAFKNNFLYTPIDLNSFKRMYEKVKSVLDPSLVMIAEDGDGVPSGFLFAVPDLFDSQRRTAIIKTVAVVPERKFQGLGTYLGVCTHKEMLQKGYTSVIHALIHESNISGNILSKESAVYRRYILTGKKLT